MIYGATRAEVEARLVTVREPALDALGFQVTTAEGVDCQLAAALAAIAETGGDTGALFQSVGGGFNWRQIAGTERLSAHSWGIAIDLNPALGPYWAWSGAEEGAAGRFENAIPPKVVMAFERYGFIWGGKWHHFDAMHFEYRPEIILHARLTAGQTQ
jgi:hypothetical protein